MAIVGWVLVIFGAVWFLISGLGILRMPDLFTRIHAGAKSSTLASLLVVFGVALLQPLWAPKLVLIGILLLLTNPIGASALARAAYKKGECRPVVGARDDYAEELK